ncbi:DEAD/DEAH box helicase family protein [Alkalihalophilus pseudofirmus]|uniref:DEAD/DEAH box helicase family protein n=1 Tax=Alkalihalophilus pseudofirmus TaxID=79885 RepID=A0AAJ2KTB3_ALKPS|nr:DEAD/DEAH box helicase family protein [Alkalihalophilus pseudofirmus]MDV2884682.1 DEAD/DEAH box helicase family protein [Alkalihalophilus pseudofirmus]
MNFKDLSIAYQYRSDDATGNIINDFYLPVLSSAKLYKRAVGYFTSSSLALVAKGVNELVHNGGKMQLIASPKLDQSDIDAIDLGYKARKDVIEAALLAELNQALDPVQECRLNYLAWLISNEILDIKIAVLKNNKGLGIYHEKIGVVTDNFENKIAFSGSSNETLGGLYNNFESIDVFCSWHIGDDIRVERKEDNFDDLWNNRTKNLEVYEFPAAVKEKLLSYKTNKLNVPDPEMKERQKIMENREMYYPKIPSHFLIRDYQQQAIKSWFRNNCQGLLEMATGTGKTITALTALSKLWENTNRLAVIIICPYTHLVDQWVKDIKQFNMNPTIAYSSRSLWEDELANYVSAFNSKVINHFCLITTNATYSSDHMQKLLNQLKGDVLLIADEAHHLGAYKNRKSLIEDFPYRLALSATPTRWYDEEGSNTLLSYFGNQVVYKYGLDKAIGTFLTEYFYYPHIITLDEDEAERYFEITRKLVRVFPRNGDLNSEDSKSAQALLIERARILSCARNKLVKLKELMNEHRDSHYNIVYCGDSQVDGERQIDRVVKLLGNDLDMNVHTFTSREDRSQRANLLERFEKKELQALVAIKCLDEGVDVPATQRAFILASSTNPREFIQRRGRVLRKHPNKKYSYIHDFIVIPREIDEVRLIEPSIFNTERKLIKRELTRFSEFADLALNGPEAHESINKVKHAYNLLDI